jgi:Protein of unknown function (DUF2927)
LRTSLAALACLAATLSAAQEVDGVAASGILSDEDFFRLVTCAAPPGKPCETPPPRWSRRDLTLRLALGSDPLPPGFKTRLDAAIDHALAEINGAGAGITLARSDLPLADISIRPTSIPEGTEMTDVPGFSGRGVMGVGYMTLWWDERRRITEAVILISTAITDEDLTSVMLEEITQSLGILYDIENPAYEGVSILSQTSNATTRIEGQDAALLRWLYPPKD